MRHFPDWLEAYINYAKEGSEAPLAFHFWTGVSTLAGAMRKRVWIDMKRFQWSPNFFIILTGPPGVVTKSTTVDLGYKLLREVPNVRIGPDVVTAASFLQEMADSTIDDPDIGVTSPLTISSSELGNFLKADDPELINSLIETWDGKGRTMLKRTVGRQFEEIPAPWFNLIGCTTPGWIAENIPEVALSGGLISRCIFVYADRKRQRCHFPDEYISDSAKEMEEKLIEDLIHISTLHGKMEISQESRIWNRAWYDDHIDKLEALSAKLDERYINTMQRKQTMLYKLVIALVASRGDELLVTPADQERAIRAIDSTERTSHKAFSMIGKPKIPKLVELLVEFVKYRGGVVTPNEAFTYFVNQVDSETFKLIVKSAIQSRQLKGVGNANDYKLVLEEEKPTIVDSREAFR